MVATAADDRCRIRFGRTGQALLRIDQYQAARKVRENIAEMNMLVISGVDNQV